MSLFRKKYERLKFCTINLNDNIFFLILQSIDKHVEYLEIVKIATYTLLLVAKLAVTR